MSELPDCPVFHVTHVKAGSVWIKRILVSLWPDEIVLPTTRGVWPPEWPIRDRGIYPTVYQSREHFFARGFPAEHRRFVVVRDLRDAVVSGYFSAAYSHEIVAGWQAELRERLRSASREDGLLAFLDEPTVSYCAETHRSWAKSGERLFRYESLVADTESTLAAIFDHCDVSIDRDRLRSAVDEFRFDRLADGRRPGEEDRDSHFRKGVVGDWTNHFTPKVAARFKQRYGDALIATGYESDLSW